MRRLSAIAAVLVVLLALALQKVSDDGAEPYRAAAVFDSARNIVPGQLVKIAGAKVGRVTDVGLTREHKARIAFDIDPKFGPFKADARCQILPEGFISENYVQCEPGTPGARELTSRDGGRPTVALGRTAVPVQLQQVIDTFSLPVSERIKVILTELGTSVAGRGRDLNALLRRANPSLTQARNVLAIAAKQNAEIDRAVVQTDAVLREADRRQDRIRGFVRNAATLAKSTSRKASPLSASFQRLPVLLRQARTSLYALDKTTAQLTPTLRNLRAAAPNLQGLTRAAATFSPITSKAADAVAGAARIGRPAVKDTVPVAERAASFAQGAKEPMVETRRFTESLRDTGGIEGLVNMLYTLSSVGSVYDDVSHMVGFNLKVNALCVVMPFPPQCSHKYDAPNQGQTPVNDPSRAKDAANDLVKSRAAAGGRSAARELNRLLGRKIP